jgi:hypothetical protein
MKTEQVMIRDNAFIQRISDGYFNATKLLCFYNNNNNEKKILGNYKKNESTKAFINQLKNENIENPLFTGRGSGNKSGTWMHPKLFIDFAMWVSVEFKSRVIDYVLDGLVKTRHDAGDYYKEMCSAILDVYSDFYKQKPPAYIFIEEANRIRELVTTKTDRNEMTEKELSQITYLQKVNANLIKKRIGKQSRIRRINEANEIKI